MNPLLAIPALALLVCAGSVFAQPVYKSTMPDGKVVYGEKPAQGAKKVDTIEPPPAKTGTTTITPQEKARAQQQPRTQPAAGAAQDRSLDEARKALQQAEAAREAGKEPLPGERQGTKGGGSRLNETYDARQKSLDDAVESARKRVSDLQSGR